MSESEAHPLKAERPDRLDKGEPERIVEWRRDRLVRAGCTQTQATALAMSRADVRRAEDMIASGCPCHLVVSILT